MNPSDIMELNYETNESLAHTVDDQGRENYKMKQRIFELGASLSPWSLFYEPFSIIHLVEESRG